MNYLPWVSQGTYGGTTTKEIANYKASWGLMSSLPLYVQALADVVCIMKAFNGPFAIKDFGAFQFKGAPRGFQFDSDSGSYDLDDRPHFTVN